MSKRPPLNIAGLPLERQQHILAVVQEADARIVELEAVNAKLLDALVNLLFTPTTAAKDAAREAIKEARK